MPRTKTTEYDRRMHAVLDYIDRNLDRQLSLADLANVANFSEFHFHRMFSTWAGEVLGDYLRRRRLETGAVRLRSQPDQLVLQIALSVGFSSNEAFARAFRREFGCTPSQWRLSKLGRFDSKADQARRITRIDHGDCSKEEPPMKVKLIDRAPADVAYLRHTGPYGQPISHFWQQKVFPWMVVNNLLGQTRYGVSLDDPSVTKPQKCRYDACIEVPKGSTLTGKPLRKVIPGGKYAVLAFKGTTQDIEIAWDRLLRDWLPTSGLQLDARPFFEHYPPTAGFDPKTGNFECEICIPVAPL